ncbi:MAG: alpha/beta hydrolase [Pirellulales bacterium]
MNTSTEQPAPELSPDGDAPPKRRLWRRLPRWLRIILTSCAAVVTAVLLLVAGVWWYLHPGVERIDGVVYGQRHEHPLTLDVIRPAHPNGYGIALMVSGSWKSGGAGAAPVWMIAPLLRRGYTIFAICHVSQPEASVMEIIEDVNRAVRYVRHHADEYGIDPDHLGVTGASAGGHLSLMLATRGGPGPADAADQVDRESSAVEAVAIFFPVTDLLNLGNSTENLGDGGPPKSFRQAFGPDAADLEKWKEIGRVFADLLHHARNAAGVDLPRRRRHPHAVGTDRVVPRPRPADEGEEVDVVVHPGGRHGWLTMIWDIRHFADWFDEHLRRSLGAVSRQVLASNKWPRRALICRRRQSTMTFDQSRRRNQTFARIPPVHTNNRDESHHDHPPHVAFCFCRTCPRLARRHGGRRTPPHS